VRRGAGALLLVTALAIVGAASAVAQRRAREAVDSPLPSATSAGARGLAAARAFLAETGRAPLRLEDPDADALPQGATVLLASPRAALSDAEAAALVAHAAAGGTVVWMAGPVRQPALERRVGVRPVAAVADRWSEPLAPHPLLDGLRLPAGGGIVEGGGPGALAVLGTAGALERAVGVSVAVGRGEVLVLAGPEPLQNDRLGEGDGLALLVRLAARGRPVFDERWLRPREAASGPGAGRGLALAAAQALLAAAVLVLARGRRLGAVRPPPPEGRGRTARDYLASLAVLYRRAGAEDELARAAWARARRRLERTAGLPARLPAGAVHARLAPRSPAAAEAFLRGEAALRGGRGALREALRAAHDLDAGLRAGARRGGTGRRAGGAPAA
jgi:hypothetical protein